MAIKTTRKVQRNQENCIYITPRGEKNKMALGQSLDKVKFQKTYTEEEARLCEEIIR
jgi:hypothetical protein